MKKYGIILGRFQPFHGGHEYIVSQVLKKDYEPIIFIGSVNKLNEKNPLTFEQRKKLIKLIFPDIKHIYPLEDKKDWDQWWYNLEKKLKTISNNKNDIIFITHKKTQDKCKFTFKDKEYFDNYQVIFELEGYKTKNIPVYKINNKVIHATDIRKNKDYAKKVLRKQIYDWLEKNNFWGKELYNKNNKYKIIEYTNWIKVYGGDGTMLKAVNKYQKLNKPFFGIGKGTMNFLMNKDEEILTPHSIELNLIGINIDDNKIQTAFNEIMIGGDMSSWITFNVFDNDEIIGKFKGGGIIISTSQGSTGINKNNGGTILPLSSKNWIITGDKTNRKINYIIEPQELKISFISRNNVYIWIDGRKIKKFERNKDYQIKILPTNKKVILWFNNIHEFKRKRKY